MMPTVHSASSLPELKGAKLPPKSPIQKTEEQVTENVFKADHAQINQPTSGGDRSPVVFFQNEDNIKSSPWKPQSLNIYYGFMPWNHYSASTLHIQQPELGTDVKIKGVQHDQRTSHTYLYGQPRFSPDEPQFNAGLDLRFQNDFGVGLNVKHNKIIVDGYEQNVDFEGLIHGEAVDGEAPLNSFIEHYELTKGNHQLTLHVSKSFDLPAPKNHRFSFHTRLGPSLIVSYSRTSLKNPDGQFEKELHPFSAVGYGGMMENALRYELGPKLGRVSLEASHGISYLNFSNYAVMHGTGSHSQWASQFSLTLGKTLQFSKTEKTP